MANHRYNLLILTGIMPQTCCCQPCVVLRGRAGEYSGIEMERLKLITFDALDALKQKASARSVALEAMKKIASKCKMPLNNCTEPYNLYGICVLDMCGNYFAADSSCNFAGRGVCYANGEGAVSLAVSNYVISKYSLTQKIVSCQDNAQVLSTLNVITTFECGPVGGIGIDSCGKIQIYTPRICMIWVYATPQSWNMGCSRPYCVEKCKVPKSTTKCCMPCKPMKICKPCEPKQIVCRPGKECGTCCICCPVYPPPCYEICRPAKRSFPTLTAYDLCYGRPTASCCPAPPGPRCPPSADLCCPRPDPCCPRTDNSGSYQDPCYPNPCCPGGPCSCISVPCCVSKTQSNSAVIPYPEAF